MGWDGVPDTSQDGHATDVTNSESRARTPIPPPTIVVAWSLLSFKEILILPVDKIQSVADILLSDPG
jgi:hypothetical protein